MWSSTLWLRQASAGFCRALACGCVEANVVCGRNVLISQRVCIESTPTNSSLSERGEMEASI